MGVVNLPRVVRFINSSLNFRTTRHLALELLVLRIMAVLIDPNVTGPMKRALNAGVIKTNLST